MAGSSGAAAYQRLEKPDNAISQGLQFWGNIAAEQGAEFRMRDEREKVRKDAELKDWEDKFGQKVGDFKATLTGFNNPDDIALRYAMDTADEYTDIYREAEKAKMSGDRVKQKELEFELIKRKNSFKTFNEASGKLNETFVRYGEDSQKGLVSGASANWEKQVQAIANSNYQVINKQGVPYLVGLDEDDKPFEVRYADVIKGDYNYIKKQDVVGTVKKISGNLGSLTEKISDKLWITEQKLWNDEIKKGAETMIDSVMTTDMVGDVLYNITGQPKDKDFTDEDRKKVKDHLLAGVRGAYTEEKKKYFDDKYGSYKNTQAQIAETGRHNRKTEGIQQQNADTSKYNAVTSRKKLDFDIDSAKEAQQDKQNPIDVQTSESYRTKFKDGQIRETTAIDLFDKKTGNQKPFIIGQRFGQKGEKIDVVATSLEMSNDGQLIRYTTNDGVTHEIAKKGSKQGLFNSLINQIEGREGDASSSQPVSSDPLNLGL